MKSVAGCNNYHIAFIASISVAGLILSSLAVSSALNAQDATKKDGRRTNRVTGKSVAGNQSLAAQLRELQIKVAKLEVALKQKYAGKMGPGTQGGSMQGMMGKGMGKKVGMGMGLMPGKKMGGMGRMSGNKAITSGMGMAGGGGKSGMAMMGKMKGMGKMQMPSALPGFAGASHIYHIGATSFFLDHSQHITLTQQQQVKLNQIKEKALLGQATSDRWISQAEQELWVLTSSDTPDVVKIEAKIREVEKLNGDKRIAYIRGVGQAAGVLTNEQRQTLVGLLPADHDAASAGN